MKVRRAALKQRGMSRFRAARILPKLKDFVPISFIVMNVTLFQYTDFSRKYFIFVKGTKSQTAFPLSPSCADASTLPDKSSSEAFASKQLRKKAVYPAGGIALATVFPKNPLFLPLFPAMNAPSFL